VLVVYLKPEAAEYTTNLTNKTTKAVSVNLLLYQFKEYGSWRIVTVFEDKLYCIKEGLDTAEKKI